MLNLTMTNPVNPDESGLTGFVIRALFQPNFYGLSFLNEKQTKNAALFFV